MKVLHAAAECFPLAKTGGLGDVVGSLPRAQRGLGLDARIVMPGYRHLYRALRGLKTVAQLQVRGHGFGVIEGTFGPTEQPIYLLDCPELFDRPGDPYRDENGREFWDNGERFACFGEAVARLASASDPFRPEVVHLHDWQAGLAAAWLHDSPRRPRIVYTIHNLAYQGLFDRHMFEVSGLPEHHWTPGGVEFWGGLSFMKAGLNYADAITTVSPTYAREIQTPEFGCALDGVLRARSGVLHGILNGIDDGVWDPHTDPLIVARYTSATVDPGKRANKHALQRELGLTPGDAPLVAFIGRLAAQKGADLILLARQTLLDSTAQFAILAGGEAQLETAFRSWAASAPTGRVAVRIAQDEGLAHRLTAAADLILMPSRYEPCGLNQMYAQRYGAIPVVHRTGGLADTVTDATYATLGRGSATGVQFNDADPSGVIYGVRRGLELAEGVETLRRLREAGMSRDFSWAASAQSYAGLYRSLA